MLYANTEILDRAALQTYRANEVAALADVDWHAVRAEGERRMDIAAKKIAKARRAMEKAMAEMAESHVILNAAFKQMAL